MEGGELCFHFEDLRIMTSKAKRQLSSIPQIIFIDFLSSLVLSH